MKAIAMAERVLNKAVGVRGYTVKAGLVNPAVQIIDGDGFTVFEYVKSGRGNESMCFECGGRYYHYLFGKPIRETDIWTSDIETADMVDISVAEFEKAFDEFLEIL